MCGLHEKITTLVNCDWSNDPRRHGRNQNTKKLSFQNFSYLFFSPCGRTLGASGSLRLFFACASASSSHACRIGFRAIMLLCDNVRLSNRQIVLCDRAPTPGNLRFASALPTSACVTPSFVGNGNGAMFLVGRVLDGRKRKRVGKK